jgi:hypothetical protein
VKGFACGVRSHIARSCKASEVDKEAHQYEYFVARHQQKIAYSNAMEIADESEETTIMKEVKSDQLQEEVPSVDLVFSDKPQEEVPGKITDDKITNAMAEMVIELNSCSNKCMVLFYFDNDNCYFISVLPSISQHESPIWVKLYRSTA